MIFQHIEFNKKQPDFFTLSKKAAMSIKRTLLIFLHDQEN